MFFQNPKLKGQNSFFSFLATLAVVILFYLISSLPLMLYSFQQGWSQSDLGRYHGPVSFALMLFVFSGILFGVMFATRRIHRRAVITVFTGASSFRWRHMFGGALVWLIVMILLEVVGFLTEPEVYTFQLDPLPFLACLLVGILILPLQTTAEEVMIRGYLMQQIGLLVPYRWIPVLVTSVFFGLLHTQNPEVLQFGLYKAMILYIGMGLFLGLITAMDDGLEIPMGIHYVNNLFSLLFVGYKGSVFEGTPTIFLKEAEDLTYTSVISNLVVMGIVLFILKFIFRWEKFSRLFKNTDSSLNESISKNF